MPCPPPVEHPKIRVFRTLAVEDFDDLLGKHWGIFESTRRQAERVDFALLNIPNGK
jgi:hypothetical protein